MAITHNFPVVSGNSLLNSDGKIASDLTTSSIVYIPKEQDYIDSNSLDISGKMVHISSNSTDAADVIFVLSPMEDGAEFEFEVLYCPDDSSGTYGTLSRIMFLSDNYFHIPGYTCGELQKDAMYGFMVSAAPCILSFKYVAQLNGYIVAGNDINPLPSDFVIPSA